MAMIEATTYLNHLWLMVLLISSVSKIHGFGSEEQENMCNSFEFSCFCDEMEVDEATDVSCSFHDAITRSTFDKLTGQNKIKILAVSFSRDDDHEIATFPSKFIQGLKSLESYESVSGTIKVLPTSAFEKISSLTSITLDDNQIGNLQEGSFAHLPNLESISLADNNLKKIRKNIFVDLPKLSELRLSSNIIASVEDGSFAQMENLGKLDLYYNNMTALTPGFFDGLRKLTQLHLERNKLTEISDGLFDGVPMLVELGLQNNRIKRISPKAFQNLKMLSVLSVSDNRITSLDSETFASMPKITSINFDGNHLKTLKKDWFKHLDLSNGLTISYQDNKFECSCELAWLMEIKTFLLAQEALLSECNVTRQYPYPDKVVGQIYKLRDFETPEKMCEIQFHPASTPKVDEQSRDDEIKGQRKSDKQFINSDSKKSDTSRACALHVYSYFLSAAFLTSLVLGRHL